MDKATAAKKTWQNRVGISPEEFSNLTGLAKITIYRHIKAGEIKAVRIGPRRLLIPVGEVERLLVNGADS